MLLGWRERLVGRQQARRAVRYHRGHPRRLEPRMRDEGGRLADPPLRRSLERRHCMPQLLLPQRRRKSLNASAASSPQPLWGRRQAADGALNFAYRYLVDFETALRAADRALGGDGGLGLPVRRSEHLRNPRSCAS